MFGLSINWVKVPEPQCQCRKSDDSLYSHSLSRWPQGHYYSSSKADWMHCKLKTYEIWQSDILLITVCTLQFSSFWCLSLIFYILHIFVYE